MPLIIKSVGISIYGGYVLLSSILMIIYGISSLGTGYKAKRFLPSTIGKINRGDLFYPQFYFGFISNIILSFLLIALDNKIRYYFLNDEVEYSVWIIPVYLISYYLYAQGSNYFRYTSRIHYMTAASITYPYFYMGLMLVFLYYLKFLSVNSILLAQSCSALLIALICLFVVMRELGGKVLFYNIQELIADIKIGFPLILNFIVDIVLIGSDRYVIAFFMTSTAVGFYNPGYVLGSLIAFIPKAMGTALPQLMAKAIDQGNGHEAQQMLNYALKIYLLLAIPFLFGSILFSKAILVLLANQEVAANSFLVTPIVAAGTVFYGIIILLSNTLFVLQKTYSMLKVNLFAAIFNLSANLILLYLFRNILVAAITTLLSYLLVFIYVKNKVEKLWPVDYHVFVILKSTIASIMMILIILMISDRTYEFTSILTLIKQIIFGIALYFVILFTLRTFTKKEIQYFKELFWSK